MYHICVPTHSNAPLHRDDELKQKKIVPHSSALMLCKFLFPCLCQKTNSFIQLACNRMLIILS